MNISLTPELDTYVQEKVKTGTYHSASEVIREGLRLLQEQDLIRQAKLELLRREIDIGIEQIERGQYKVYEVGKLHQLAEDVIAEGRRRLESRRNHSE